VERLASIVDAMRDPALFGGMFPDLSTWKPWQTFLKALYGLEMDGADLELFRKHTGRQKPRKGGYMEAVAITGRQSGKTYIAGAVAVYEASRALLVGERDVYIPLAAQDTRSSQRALFGYVSRFAESPVLKSEITRQTATEITLANRVTIGVYPCRPAAIRGIRAACAVVDELAFFTSTDGRPTDIEMLRAVRPSLATTGGRLLILSSPYGQSGALYELHRKHYGRDDSNVLIWQATAPEMNPTLAADYLQRMEQDDPEAYRSEVLGLFRAGVATFLDPAALDAVLDTGTRERPPEKRQYVAYADAASGSGKDSFAVGIAHREGRLAVLDCIRYWNPPFNPSGVIAEASDLLRRYRIREARGDRYAANFVSEGFRAHDINYVAADRNTSDTYLELLPLINAGAVLILDEPRLLRELRGLERKRGPSGRDRVDHRSGSHDDAAVACAGALVAASVRTTYSLEKMILGCAGDKPKDADRWPATAPFRRSGIPLND